MAKKRKVKKIKKRKVSRKKISAKRIAKKRIAKKRIAKKRKRKISPKKTFRKKISVKKILAKKVFVKSEIDKVKKNLDAVKKTKIRVIGIGGGAGNIISEIATRIRKASFLVANTDQQALKSIHSSVLRFQFGIDTTYGLGTGMNTELAMVAAQSEKEKIKRLFRGQDLCILIASLGGGAGSGALPVFAKAGKSAGVITLGIFTLPFTFEGSKKSEIAIEALQKTRPYMNAISILPNERIFQMINKNTPLKEALSAINKNLADSLEALVEIIYLPGLINIDFADLKAILQGPGRLAYLNTVEVNGKNRVLEAIRKVLNCPLYPYSIKGAKSILFNIAGEKKLTLSEISHISNTISELVNPEAKIIFGISQRKEYQDKIRVTLLATGCTAKVFTEETVEPLVSLKKRAGRRPTIFKSKRKIKAKKTKPRKKKSKIKKTKKIKVKVSRGSKLETPLPKIEDKSATILIPTDHKTEINSNLVSDSSFKIRKNALQIKKETEEMEKGFLEKEKFWETPAFLRKQQK